MSCATSMRSVPMRRAARRRMLRAGYGECPALFVQAQQVVRAFLLCVHSNEQPHRPL